MSDLQNVAIQQFKDSFTVDYRSMGVLGNGRTTQIYRGLKGDAFKMPIQGSLVMKDRGPLGSQLPQATRSYTQSIITFTEKAIMEAIDEFEEALLNINVIGTLPGRLAESAARMEDQIIIDALMATTVPALNDIAVDQGTSGTNTNMTIAKLQLVKQAFDKQNVPSKDRFLLVTPSQVQSLLDDEKATSSLYVSTKNMMTGDLETILGFNIISLGDMDEGGLVNETANVRSCFAWQKGALGVGFTNDPSVDVWFEKLYNSNMAKASMRLGAVTSLPKGVAKIYCDES